MVIDWGLLLLGVLFFVLGGIAFSASFRRKFFIGLRKFISGIGGKQAPKSQDPGYTDDRSRIRRIRTIHMIVCPTCKGRKKVPAKLPAIADQSLAGMVKCPTCDGTGEVEEGTVE